MNVKQRILELNRQYCEKFEKKASEDIGDLLITFISKYQLFEPCRYLSEDDEWVNIAAVSPEDETNSQALSIKKSEITTIGIYEPEDNVLTVKPPSEDFYQ